MPLLVLGHRLLQSIVRILLFFAGHIILTALALALPPKRNTLPRPRSKSLHTFQCFLSIFSLGAEANNFNARRLHPHISLLPKDDGFGPLLPLPRARIG
jgi:hypothetical protein